MTEHFNGLSEAEQERLSILIEECGEVIQAACKILRHGYASNHPVDPWHGTNRRSLEKEIGHIIHVVSRMENASDLDSAVITESAQAKAANITTYLHHQEPSR